MNIKLQYKRFKEWQRHAFDWNFDEKEPHHCVNCDNDFVGNYCPYCSQKAGLKKVSWKSVRQSIAEVWGMHNRSLLYSLWQLIWRPGYFISDYINGRRQVSFPPVKMLMLMALVSVLVDCIFGGHHMNSINSQDLIDPLSTMEQVSPGWFWLILTCFFLVPTWILFRYAPRNTKPSLPQCFFIHVFMGVETLIIDDLADFFTPYFYILLPLCFFYAYRQLFGYGVWPNFWRVMLVQLCGTCFFFATLMIIDMSTHTPEHSYVFDVVTLALFVIGAIVPLTIGWVISFHTFKKRVKEQPPHQDTPSLSPHHPEEQ